jgi:hypothetical protein
VIGSCDGVKNESESENEMRTMRRVRGQESTRQGDIREHKTRERERREGKRRKRGRPKSEQEMGDVAMSGRIGRDGVG